MRPGYDGIKQTRVFCPTIILWIVKAKTVIIRIHMNGVIVGYLRVGDIYFRVFVGVKLDFIIIGNRIISRFTIPINIQYATHDFRRQKIVVFFQQRGFHAH